MKVPGYHIEERIPSPEGVVVQRGHRQSDGISVVIKSVSASDRAAAARLRRHAEIGALYHFARIANVIELIEHHDGLHLVTENAGPLSLRAIMQKGQVTAVRAWHIMRGIMTALDELHASNIVHGDLHPGNVVIHPETNDVMLIDLGLSFVIGQDTQTESMGVMEGAVAYMAPEKTGRTSYMVDTRADLYSAGVIFYEMVTGRLPFDHHDMLEMLHAHLAQVPRSAHELSAEVPAALSAMIDLMLVKDPDERYQSAFGVISDLTSIEDAADGTVVQMRMHDVNERYIRRQTIIGRDHERSVLRRFITASNAEKTMCVISAPAGAGKSALVTLTSSIALEHGMIVARGACDRSSEVPLSGIASLADHLIRAVLRMPAAEVQEWLHELTAELDASLPSVASVVPVLSTLIDTGSLADTAVSAGDAQRRLNVGLLAFFSITMRRFSPLLVIEDLHWADDATLDLVELIGRSDRSSNAKVLITFRTEDQTTATENLTRVYAIAAQGGEHEHLHLTGLLASDVQRLIDASFNLVPTESAELLSTVMQATNGSPLFVEQYLGLLVEQGSLVFDRSERRWKFLTGDHRSDHLHDGLTGILARRFATFSPHEQRVLALLATMGTRTSLHDLIAVSHDRDEVMSALAHAISSGVVLRHADEHSSDYSFVHDKLRLHAEGLITAEQRGEIHRDYAILLLEQYRDHRTDSLIYRIADHITRAQRSLFPHAILTELLSILDTASTEARRSGVIDAALQYMKVAIEIEGMIANPVARDIFERHLRYAECLGNRGSLPDAHKELDRLSASSYDDLTSARLWHLRLILYNLETRYEESVVAGRTALRFLGINLPVKPSQLTIGRTLLRAWRRQLTLDLNRVVTRSLCTDEGAILAMDVLQYLQAPSYNLDENLFACVLLERSDLVFRYGHADTSIDAYGTFGVFLRMIGAVNKAEQFANVSVQLASTSRDLRARANSIFTSNTIVYHWMRDLDEVVDGLNQSVQLAEFSGDTAILAYSCGLATSTAWYAGHGLDAITQRSDGYVQKLRQAWQHQEFPPTFATYYHAGIVKFVAAHHGTEHFSESALDLLHRYDEIYRDVMASGNSTAICYLHLFEAASALINDDLASFHEHVAACTPWERGMIGQLLSVVHTLFTAIDHGLHSNNVKGATKALKQLRDWERYRPRTFAARRMIAEAAVAACSNDRGASMRLLSSARQAATSQGDEITTMIIDAVSRLVDPTSQLKPQPEVEQPRHRDVTYAATYAVATDELDIASVVKATTTIAKEIDLDKLHQGLLRILVENAGAGRAVIAAPHGEAFRTEASYGSGTSLCEGLIREALWTKQPVVVNDATMSEYRTDAHIVANGVRSVMAYPVLHQGRISVILYLENRNIAGAFSPNRLRFLELLAGQIAVSIENARLYEEQRRTLESAARFVPREFLDSLGISSIRDVRVGEAVTTPMTVLFVDIRGFTSLSETLSVTDTFRFLNSYLSVVAPCITKHHGFIDKYIGDAVMALFPREAADAVRAATEIVVNLTALDGINVTVGIGIHSGEVMLGTVGSAERLDTTVIGDTVNLAARLEELTKELPWNIIISDDVYHMINGVEASTSLGEVAIRGRSTPLVIHGISPR